MIPTPPKEGEETPPDTSPCQSCGADMDTSDDDLFFAFQDAGFLPGELQVRIAKLKKKYRFVKRS